MSDHNNPDGPVIGGDRNINDWADLDDFADLPPTTRTPITVTDTARAYGNDCTETTPKGSEYPHICTRCDGTGVYTYGYRTRQSGKCFACNGKGGFKTSSAARRKARASRAASKAKKGQSNLDLFARNFPQQFAYLNDNNNGSNEFKVSMLTNIQKYGDLTENMHKAIDKGIAREAKWAAERELKNQNAPRFDPKPLQRAFETASKGSNKPTLRTEFATFTLAPAYGKNPGCIYIKNPSRKYLGKITPRGQLLCVPGVDADIQQHIIDAAQDPLKLALVYGQKTGKCSCCNRLLTNKLSIELGIGPICRERWGL